MGDNNLEGIISLQRMFAYMSKFEKQQAKEDLAELQGKMKEVTLKVQATVKSLRRAADTLDKVWQDCKIAHACGTSAGILGGILTIGGGIATILTAGIAAPLLLGGMGVGAAGAGTNLGTSIAKVAINSAEIKEAEKDWMETLECINEVKTTTKLWLDRKEEARLLYIFHLAAQTLELSDPVIKHLEQVILCNTSISPVIVEAATRVFVDVGRSSAQAAGQAGEQLQAAGQAGAQLQAAGKAGAQAAGDVAETGAKAGTKAGAKIAGGLIIGASVLFLLVDAVDLGFTIKDLVEKKGSKAAEDLRTKADELEQQ